MTDKEKEILCEDALTLNTIRENIDILMRTTSETHSLLYLSAIQNNVISVWESINCLIFDIPLKEGE